VSVSDRHAPGLRRNQSLQRGAALLDALGDRPEGASAAALARATGLPRPTAGRLLATLADLGLVQRLPSSDDWVLGPAIVRLGRAADPFGHIVRVARPHLAALAEDTGESATLTANPTPTTVEVVAQVDASRLVGITDWVGRRFPLHASAAGKLALAALPADALDAYLVATPLLPITAQTITDAGTFRRHLAEVREQGYAASVDELEDGLTGLAVPVPAGAGTPLLTVATGGPSGRSDAARPADLLAAMRACAERIGAAVG
jgi:IclR family pca regulon transcriptional regulator